MSLWRRRPRLLKYSGTQRHETGGISQVQEIPSQEPSGDQVPAINWGEKLREAEGWLKDFDNENLVWNAR